MSMVCVETKTGDLFAHKLGNTFGNKANPGGLFVGALDRDGKW